MKRITIRVAVALCTFIIGIIVAAVWLISPASHISDATLDSTIYPVKFCELIRNSEKYDGKIVRIQALYEQGIDTSALTDSDCEEWLRPRCNREDAPCEKIWSDIGLSNARVDVIGRFTADIVDPDPNQNGYHVRLFEMLELKDAKPTRDYR